MAIKSIRNIEAHRLDVKLQEYLKAPGLVVGIGGIYKIASVVYPEVDELK